MHQHIAEERGEARAVRTCGRADRSVTLRYFPNVSNVRRARPRLRAERSDGVENRQRILAAATAAVIPDGLKVPLATVASAAGVGTLYRHFPSRAALLDGLVVQSLRLVVDDLRAAAGEAPRDPPDRR
jgi:AcrR family transcriptional regulator